MKAQVRHVGYVVDEFAGVVVPFASAYARRDDAERAAREAVRAMGYEPTACEVFPASREEEARELAEWAALDSEARAWQTLPALELEPGAARSAEAERRERERAPYLPTMPADAAIEVLAAHGYAAAYSKGGNLWVNAPESDDLRPFGLRWSAKRGQWWARLERGGAVVTQYTRRDQIRAA